MPNFHLLKRNKRVLRKFTRSIDGYLVEFYIVQRTLSILCGLVQFSKKTLETSYDPAKVKDADLYRVSTAVRSFAYNILSTESTLMTTP